MKNNSSNKQPNLGQTCFQSVNPWRIPFTTLHRRHLPHLETPSATYFATFCCAAMRKMPKCALEISFSAVKYWDGIRIDLDTGIVMPDHVHLIFRIIDDSTLGSILQSIKGFSSREINKMLNRNGTFWLNENFDHIIRNAEQWRAKVEYVRQNPVKKGLVDKPEDYPFLYVRKQLSPGEQTESLFHPVKHCENG